MANAVLRAEHVDAGRLTRIRQCQSAWAGRPVRDRLAVVRSFRHALAEQCAAVSAAVLRPPSETLMSEVLPLLEACRFLERKAESLLAPRREGIRGRPVWLPGVHIEIRREPLGVVLIIGPSNYPLYLAGVQALQALIAGNAVLLKPGRGASAVLGQVRRMLVDAGLPPEIFELLGEAPECAQHALGAGVDKIFLTGSSETGRRVLADAAKPGIPAVMELSGCDPVIVLEGADLDLAAEAISFGAGFNGGRTCIAPKRIIALAGQAPGLQNRLSRTSNSIPVHIARDVEDAIRKANSSPWALGATIFGPEAAARKVAARLQCGAVVINDMIVPTADPRFPFGGRKQSGFGVTRGAEGLFEMTAVKAIAVRRMRWYAHFTPPKSGDAVLFANLIAVLHGRSARAKLQALRNVVELGRNRMKDQPE